MGEGEGVDLRDARDEGRGGRAVDVPRANLEPANRAQGSSRASSAALYAQRCGWRAQEAGERDAFSI